MLIQFSRTLFQTPSRRSRSCAGLSLQTSRNPCPSGPRTQPLENPCEQICSFDKPGAVSEGRLLFGVSMPLAGVSRFFFTRSSGIDGTYRNPNACNILRTVTENWLQSECRLNESECRPLLMVQSPYRQPSRTNRSVDVLEEEVSGPSRVDGDLERIFAPW